MVTNRFSIEVDDDVEATLCFLLEMDEVAPEPTACRLILDGEAVEGVVARGSDNGKRVEGVGDQDVSDALSEIKLGNETPGEASIRFVSRQSEFQGYATEYYYHNHWLWILADVGPGRHDAVFNVRFPPVPSAWLGGPRFGSWLREKRRLSVERVPLEAWVAGEASPELFLPEEELETTYAVISPYQRI